MDNYVIQSGDVVSVQVGAQSPLVSVEVVPATVGVVTVSGPQGPPGQPGLPGPAYEGVAWWYGTGEPDVVVGAKPGDYFVDTSTGNIFILGD